MADSPIPSDGVLPDIGGVSSRGGAAKQDGLATKLKLPNIHTGLHLQEVAQEYGGCGMVFTLLGEDKHKYATCDPTLNAFSNLLLS